MCGCRQISTKKLGKVGPFVCAFGIHEKRELLCLVEK